MKQVWLNIVHEVSSLIAVVILMVVGTALVAPRGITTRYLGAMLVLGSGTAIAAHVMNLPPFWAGIVAIGGALMGPQVVIWLTGRSAIEALREILELAQQARRGGRE